MFPGLIASFLLLALCVIIHSMGIALLLRFTRSRPPATGSHPWRAALFIVRVAWWLVALHLIQVVIWAIYFRVQGCLPDFETALYFSGVSYSTLGYGDVVLPDKWRMLGPAEGLTGILMCGFSTGLFFAIVHRLLEARAHRGMAGGKSGPT
jgi:hypothetical protein